MPWPQRVEKYPEAWPERIGELWIQAKRSLADENWDAAAVMARSALQLASRDKGATGRNLKSEIEDLGEKGQLPPVMKEWMHEVRELANEAAHPSTRESGTDPKDAADILRFLDYFLDYLYTLPDRINKYRERRAQSEEEK